MSDQAPEPQQNQELSRSAQYFIGIGIGLIPLILALIALGGLFNNSSGIYSTLLSIALFLYAGELIAAIVCTIISRVRFVGYGFLTMFVVTPIIAFIACTVLISMPYR